MAKQTNQPPTAASIIASIQAGLQDRLREAPGVGQSDGELAMAEYERATTALLLAVIGDWPADLARDEQFVLSYVREQAQKEADIILGNATARAQIALRGRREHWRATIDAERKRQARAARQRPA